MNIFDRNVYFQANLKVTMLYVKINSGHYVTPQPDWQVNYGEIWSQEFTMGKYDNTNMKQRVILGPKVCRLRSELVLSIVSSTCGR